jgi:5-methylcytosine-specific restriction endonuclease McrA
MPYRPKDPEPYRDREWLEARYHDDQLSTKEIADLLEREYDVETTKETIRRWLDRHEIETRSQSEACRLAMEKSEDRRALASRLLAGNRENSWEIWGPEKREVFRSVLSARRTAEGNPMFGVTGSDHPQWNPDREAVEFYSRPEWIDARQDCYERDKWTCQDCGARDQPLHAHHITPYSAGGEPFDLENLVALCPPCHSDRHQ